MTPISRRLLWITLIESFAACLVESGIFFYAREKLAFSDTLNLLMAVLFGVMFVTGTWLSQFLSRHIGERRTLALSCVIHLLIHALMAMELGGGKWLITLNTALALMTGMKWPVIESYVSAGHTPVRAARAIGLFNLTWSTAAIPALAVSGLLITYWSPALFIIPAAINGVTLLLIVVLTPRPVHLADDHPHQLTHEIRERYTILLTSSRCAMMFSFILLFVLTPLLPGILSRLGYAVAIATVVAGFIHLMRTISFFALERQPWWHGRADVLVVSTLSMSVGCAMVLFANHLAWVLVGEMIFGMATGLTYYAALYYAMVTANASVDASAKHEGLIGVGFIIGPLVGLMGLRLGDWIDSEAVGMMLTIGPLFVVCIVGTVWPLRRLVKRSSRPL